MSINGIGGYGMWTGLESIAAEKRAINAHPRLDPDTKRMAAIKADTGMSADEAIYTAAKEQSNAIADASFKDILNGKKGIN